MEELAAVGTAWATDTVIRRALDYYYSRGDQSRPRQRKNIYGQIPLKHKRKKALKRKNLSKKNKKQITKLNKRMKNNEGTVIYRWRDAKRIINANYNQCTYDFWTGNGSDIVETGLKELRYFDPNDPANLITVDATAGTQSKSVLCQVSSKVCILNNYYVPCVVTCYMLEPRQDTSQNPLNCLINGFTDVGGLAITDPLSYPSDSILFQDLWKIKKKVKILLQPNDKKTFHMASKPFEFDPSLQDTHNLQYQRQYKAHAYLFKVEGTLAHDDNVATEQGFDRGGIETSIDRTVKMVYDAGIDLHYYVSRNDSRGFTGSTVVTMQNVSQESFSIV